jgi:hypothetical protein
VYDQHLPKTVPGTIIAYACKLVSGFINIVIEVSSSHSSSKKRTELLVGDFNHSDFTENCTEM